MSISVRELFSRQDIVGEIISLRNSLANHPQGLQMSLREAHGRLLKLNDGDGFSRGCLPPGTLKIDYGVSEKDVGLVLPEWVPVSGNTQLVRDHRPGTTGVTLFPDHIGETRIVEGILTESRITHEDFQFKPWHAYYDWQFYVRVDPQYRYLLSEGNIKSHGGDIIENEWDTGDPDGNGFLPSWAWPQVGDRVWMVGRWVYDCGHPENGHRTELHPPKAVVSFRSEPVKFRENNGLTRADNAVVYIGQDGGYWRQPINDQDYAFDLYLPPKPYAEAIPVWNWEEMTALPVAPQIAPYPAANPRALRVVIPLKGVNPHPEGYGAIISAGWSDPRGTESAKIRRVRVSVREILMDANLDPTGDDEWYVYVGINGRWKVWKSLSGARAALDFSIDLGLHAEDKIHLTAGGFEADEIHDLMGKDIGLSWAEICDRNQGVNGAKKIRGGFLSLGVSLDPGIENEPIGIFSESHPSDERGEFVRHSNKKDYRLRYTIEGR